MLFQGINVGFALTGSFCTFAQILPEIQKILDEGAIVYPILSETVANTDTRYGRADDLKLKLNALTGKDVIQTIVDAEPIGPKNLLDVLIIAPCTGNTHLWLSATRLYIRGLQGIWLKYSLSFHLH